MLRTNRFRLGLAIIFYMCPTDMVSGYVITFEDLIPRNVNLGSRLLCLSANGRLTRSLLTPDQFEQKYCGTVTKPLEIEKQINSNSCVKIEAPDKVLYGN